MNMLRMVLASMVVSLFSLVGCGGCSKAGNQVAVGHPRGCAGRGPDAERLIIARGARNPGPGRSTEAGRRAPHQLGGDPSRQRYCY